MLQTGLKSAKIEPEKYKGMWLLDTVKLYEQDAYQTQFQARVLTCQPLEGKKKEPPRWQVTLDQTCFYPEGGGQPCDYGVLGEARVTDVQIQGGVVSHTVDQALEIGAQVFGKIDWERRFDLMQQHSGEHIVSGIVHSLFGYDNVGFHMGADLITVDWNGILTREDLLEIERRANALIWQDRETEITVPTREELPTLEYRSKKALEWPVRIVTFPGADTCACCGTHVRRAGEIGLVKLLSVVKMRSGVRVEMVAGARAYRYLAQVTEENHRTSQLLSAKEGETAAYVQKLYDEHQALKQKCAALETACNAALAEQYAGKGDCLLFTEGLDSNGLRRLAVAVMERCGGVCMALSPNEGGYAYCIGREGGDVRPLVKELNQALQGRGGGKPNFAQGAVKADRNEIQVWWTELQG